MGKGKVKDITGQRFGRLVAIRQTGERKHRCAIWECKCDCGNITLVQSSNLQKGNTRSCGCLHNELCAQLGKNSVKDITGQRFGRLIAIRLMDERKKGLTVWECKCDCGNMTQVLYSNLQGGNTKSCGCLQRELGKNIKDLTGKRFGRLVVTRLMDERRYGSTVWECKCDCGNVTQVQVSHLQNGDTRSCGCLQREIMAQIGKGGLKDLTGQRFGKLEVIRLTDMRKNGSSVWECKCDCGNMVLVQSGNLHNGTTKSCGCFSREQAAERGRNMDLSKQLGLVENTSVSIISSKKVRKDSQTGHRGVGYNKRAHKYYSYIGFKKKLYHLGYFSELEDAIKARKRAEEEIFEPFLKWYKENYPKDKCSKEKI